MPGGLLVTPAVLASLSAAATAVKVELDLTPDLVGDCSSALGSAVLTSALGAFVSGWRDGRAAISAQIGDLGQLLDQAAAAYTQTETGICAAMGTS